MSDQIESKTDFADSPRGWAERWGREIESAKKQLECFHKDGDEAANKFLDEQTSQNNAYDVPKRLPLFSSTIITLQAMLYGKTPTVDVARRFSDSEDDSARVAAEMFERMLNTDIERDSDSYSEAMELALSDRLLPGLGQVRLRYVAEFETQPAIPAQTTTDPVTGETIELAPEVPEQQVKSREDVETDYVNWKDFLWSPSRVWNEVRWVAFRAFMSRDDVIERFGEEIGNRVPLIGEKREGDDRSGIESDPWARAAVWEIWCKDSRRVYWFVEGFDVILDMMDDPLGLEGFWPCPKPMMSNLTTKKLIPKSDYKLSKGLYTQIDVLFTRIGLLEDAIRVAGVYDKASEGVSKLLSETGENRLYPVDNWAAFAEKGGMQGAMAWMPLEVIVAAADKLQQKLEQKIQLLYQISGMSDIMRGATNPGETLGAQQLKAKFASIRVQRMQDDVAKFASNTQRIRAEIISKHFDEQTIIERSNITRTADRDLAMEAVQLIKSQFYGYRIDVKPESVAMTDFAALKAERTEFLSGLANFVPPIIAASQQLPGSLPIMLEFLKWVMAGYRGASTIEGVMDQAIAAAKKMAQQPPQPPPPDPGIEKEKTKIQGDLAKTKMQIQGDIALEGERTKGKVVEQQAQALFQPRGIPTIPGGGQ